MTSDIIIVYVTCGSIDEARMIGRTLVEERLAACANLRPHEAIYRWEDAVETADEIGLLLKTKRALYNRLEARVLALHRYATPCVVAWDIGAGAEEFCDWVRESTA